MDAEVCSCGSNDEMRGRYCVHCRNIMAQVDDDERAEAYRHTEWENEQEGPR